MTEPLTVQEAMRRTREMLATAQRGLDDLVGDNPLVRVMGLYNVVTFGRATTISLQRLRGIDRETFDAWYAPYQAEMAADDLMRYFNTLRNTILKEGPPPLSGSIHIEYLNTDDLQPILSNPPPGADCFFIGDVHGGNGSNVTLPDGTQAKYYVQLPPEVSVTFGLHTPDAPAAHLNRPVTDRSARRRCVRSTSSTSRASLRTPTLTSPPDTRASGRGRRSAVWARLSRLARPTTLARVNCSRQTAAGELAHHPAARVLGILTAWATRTPRARRAFAG